MTTTEMTTYLRHQDEADLPRLRQHLERGPRRGGVDGHVRRAADDTLGERVVEELFHDGPGDTFVGATRLGREDVAIEPRDEAPAGRVRLDAFHEVAADGPLGDVDVGVAVARLTAS